MSGSEFRVSPVEQSFVQPLDADRWRRAAILSSAVAALELVALVAAGVALFGGPLAHRLEAAGAKAREHAGERPRPSVRTPATARPTLSRAETSVIVLNGNGRSGAAATAAEIVRARGYVVGGVGNAPRANFTRTLVMYRAGYAPEAARLARDLHVKLVGPLDGLRPRELLGAHLALIVGR
jgi:hypothetical protein